MTQAVLFDLDGTLVAFNEEVHARALSGACVALAARCPGLDPAVFERQHRAVTPNLWWAADAAVVRGERVDGLALITETFRQALIACGHDGGLAGHAFRLYWQRRGGIFPAFDDVKATLEALRGRYRLAVITNGPAVTQLDKLELCGLAGYFDLFVASGEVGAAKPDAAVFHHALERLGVSPREAWHVGDSLAADIAGAHNARLAAGVWLNRLGAAADPALPAPHHAVRTLGELPALLGAGPAPAASPGTGNPA